MLKFSGGGSRSGSLVICHNSTSGRLSILLVGAVAARHLGVSISLVGVVKARRYNSSSGRLSRCIKANGGNLELHFKLCIEI